MGLRSPAVQISRGTPLNELPELLRVEEASAWLGTTKGLVYELARRGDLPSVRLGRLLRITRAGLAAMVEKSGTDAPGLNRLGQRR
jgi:excisionase family DNA binding protein